MAGQQEPKQELDVRPLRKPDKHPAIFATYRTLLAGEWFVLVNDHDPKHLRDEFETEYGSFGWEYLTREPRNWRIKITKLQRSAAVDRDEGAAIAGHTTPL